MTYRLPPASYDEALARRAADSQPSMSGGSGYFAPRAQALDPSLFERGDHLRPEVRRLVLSTLYRFWQRRYAHPHLWSKVWIAGSGITPAWNASREANGAPGDLDCLLGIDYEQLRVMNSGFAGSSDAAIAHFLNQELHDELWSRTDHTRIGQGVYEVTYYINAGVGTEPDSLLTINPYAAYNVTDDVWTLRPVEVPTDFSPQYFSEADRATTEHDRLAASTLLYSFSDVRQRIVQADEPEQVNLLRRMHEIIDAGVKHFDDIHQGRRAAFATGGKGYFDPANYRWQAAKASGAITVLRSFKQLSEAAHRDVARGCDDVEHLLLLGALVNGGRR